MDFQLEEKVSLLKIIIHNIQEYSYIQSSVPQVLSRLSPIGIPVEFPIQFHKRIHGRQDPIRIDRHGMKVRVAEKVPSKRGKGNIYLLCIRYHSRIETLLFLLCKWKKEKIKFLNKSIRNRLL